MVPRPGTRDRTDHARAGGGTAAAAARLGGFWALAVAAMGLFAAVVILPELARLREAEYQLARQQAVNADLRNLVAANDRLIAALPTDPVLTKRLAMNQLGLWPDNEFVLIDARPTGGNRRPRPGVVALTPTPRPERPGGWVLNASRRVANPPTRRGLLLLAAVALLAAILLFPGKEREKPKRPTVIHMDDERSAGHHPGHT